MPTTRTYSPLPPMIPAGDIFRADPCDPRVPDSCPHTYGVRMCSCAAFATEPCRPTACISAAPFRHTPYSFRPRWTATVWRNLQQHPQCDIATTTLHSPLSTLHSSHTFSAKERDSETGLSYFGSRYYSSDLSIWLSVDPMSDKYPSLSPYVYCADNPVKLVDPNGEEGIVVSGGEYNGNRYKYNFIEPAINRLKELKSAGGDESITWAVMTAGYSEEDIAKFQSIANDLGVQFQAIGSAEEFTNYLNSKDINSPFLSDARTGDKITSLTVFGHGFVGSVEFAYNQDNQSSFSWGMESIVKLHRGAFENAIIDLYSCNSATDVEGGKSLAYTLAIMTGSTVTGFKGQSTYSEMNKGQGFMAKWNRWLNGFNSNGSVTLPKAGTGARKKIFVHK